MKIMYSITAPSCAWNKLLTVHMPNPYVRDVFKEKSETRDFLEWLQWTVTSRVLTREFNKFVKDYTFNSSEVVNAETVKPLKTWCFIRNPYCLYSNNTPCFWRFSLLTWRSYWAGKVRVSVYNRYIPNNAH